MTVLSTNLTEETMIESVFDIKNSKLLCIINPISGQRKIASYEETVKRLLGPKARSLEIAHTKFRGHAAEIARQGADEGRIILVVGGDGTFNEVGSVLVKTNAVIGLIPKGSGNGLACEWKIPLEPEAACKGLLNSKILTIDAGKFNSRYFFNIAGIGLDAQVGWAFDKHPTRGKLPYYYLTLKEMAFHKMPAIEVTINGHERVMKPLLVAFANGKQYGDGAEIAPKASMTDGLLHAVMIPETPIWKVAIEASRLFNKTMDQCSFAETLTLKEAVLHLPEPLPYHLDGEPFCDAQEIRVGILPEALRVLVPQDYPLK
ncbi:MAG: diacylglycerol kinase family lipid kinase [Elusimicrobia bacterium]|nr:diacylglycerol kinase family lipid kinase [Elusimicrobiota bacterium]